MPSTQKDNRSDVPQPLIPLRESAAGAGGRRGTRGGQRCGGGCCCQEGRKRDSDARARSYRDKGPITRVTRGLLIAE